MINLLNRKNLLALFLGLACLSANSVWGMIEDGVDVSQQHQTAHRSKFQGVLSDILKRAKVDATDDDATPVPLPPTEYEASGRTRLEDGSGPQAPTYLRLDFGQQSEPSVFSKLIKRKNIDLMTTALRDIAIGTEMYAEHKYGADSKAALASGIATNVARLLNDISSLYNLYKKCEDDGLLWNHGATLAPMALSLMDIIIKSKKFINKKGPFTEKQQTDTQVKVSKIIEKLHKYTPVAEMILVTVRSINTKWNIFGTDDIQVPIIYFSTVFLNLARATQVIAQSRMDKSNLLLAAGIGTAALAVLAVLLEFNIVQGAVEFLKDKVTGSSKANRDMFDPDDDDDSDDEDGEDAAKRRAERRTAASSSSATGEIVAGTPPPDADPALTAETVVDPRNGDRVPVPAPFPLDD